MQQIFHEIKINTKGQGLYDFTTETVSWLNKQKINNGILNINILHTSAALVIQENADPDVLYDLKNFYIWDIKFFQKFSMQKHNLMRFLLLRHLYQIYLHGQHSFLF